MLITKDVVVIKDGQKVVKVVNYDRVWLTYSQGDEVVNREKKSGDTVVATITEPKEEKSVVTDLDRLEAEAYAEIKKLYPNSDPRLKLLEAAEYGMDLWKRGKIQAAERPGKPVDVDKSIEKSAKILVAAGICRAMDAALAQIRA